MQSERTDSSRLAGDTPKGVLVIYTGGTIGMVHRERRNPRSPLVPGSLDDVLDCLPPSVRRMIQPIDHYKFDPLLDSSCMKIENWLEIARLIGDNNHRYEGFVVLHGTDTMAYTASALSFLLENLAKPVILTGSVLPISEPRTDGVLNLVNALELAAPRSMGLPVVPEVCVLFGSLLLRGNRAHKSSARSFDAFESPNYEPLGTSGERLEIAQERLLPISAEPLYVNQGIEGRVGSLEIFPGMSLDLLAAACDPAKLRGLVLKTFGAGNAPTDRDFLGLIRRAVEGGMLVLNVTQCREGRVEQGLYEASAGLARAGAISGEDITAEAAVTKLMVLLAKDWDDAIVRLQMRRSVRGELTDRQPRVFHEASANGS